MKETGKEKEKDCSCTQDDNCCCDDNCTCGDECTCGENCQCGDECQCGENCTCGDECHCSDECDCKKQDCDKQKCEGCNEGDEKPDNCNCVNDEKVLADQYLALARQVQADFENFRRHAIEDIKLAKIDGQASVIEAFLPCLDTFKEAKKSISDEVVLKGVEMIENKILDTLKALGVEKISSVGEIYNPHLHNAIMVMKDESKDNNIILDEYQAGYKFKDKVIRYSKVIVNKKED